MTKLRQIQQSMTQEESEAMAAAFSRLDMDRFISDSHYTANLLHPVYRGSRLTDEERKRGIEGLTSLCRALKLERPQYLQLNRSLNGFEAKGEWQRPGLREGLVSASNHRISF